MTTGATRRGRAIGLAFGLAMALPMGAGAQAQQAAAPAATAVEVPTGASGAAAAGTGIPIGKTGLTLNGLGTAASDYLFRGISQTRNTWAFQGAADLTHESGLYVGTFVSNAKFLGEPWNDTRQEVDALAGYRFSLGKLAMDVGWIGYFYPGQQKAPGTQLNEFQEVALKGSYTVDRLKLLGAFNFSPNWFGGSGKGYYVEIGSDLSLPWSLTSGFRMGRQWIERNTVFGTPDYYWYSLSISRDVIPGQGLTAALGWYATNISRSQCVPFPERAPGGQSICAGRVVFSLTKVF